MQGEFSNITQVLLQFTKSLPKNLLRHNILRLIFVLNRKDIDYYFVFYSDNTIGAGLNFM